MRKDRDVATTKRVIDAQNGPVVVVGHSYGGAVITAAADILQSAVERERVVSSAVFRWIPKSSLRLSSVQIGPVSPGIRHE